MKFTVLSSVLIFSLGALSLPADAGEILYDATMGGGLVTFTPNGTPTVLNPSTADQPCGLAANNAGTVAMADCNYNALNRYAANGSSLGNQIGVTNMYFQGGMVEDGAGNIYASSYHGGMWEISPSNVATEIESTFIANGMTWDSSGNIWGTSGSEVEEYSTGGTLLSSFSTAAYTTDDADIALNSSGDVYVYDAYHGAIDEYSSTGAFLELIASGSYLDGPQSGGSEGRGYISIDDEGDLFVAPYNGTSIYEISPEDSVSTFATLSSGTLGAMTIEDVGAPEPGTWALMLAGAALLLAGKKKFA